MSAASAPQNYRIAMNKLSIDYEWEDPGGARGPELRATWARLRMAVDGNVITRVEDHASHGLRDGVYLPLYPVAEWMAMNWWSLLGEVASPGRENSKGYWRRHNLAAASEGFALPRLLIRPGGEGTFSLDWRSVQLPDQRVSFLGGGQAVVDGAELIATLGGFIRAVIGRLEEEGIRDSLLAEEWAAIEATDPEERDFCMAAGRLGLDPYDIQDETITDAIIRISETLPASLANEFYAAADPRLISEQGGILLGFLSEAGELDLDISTFRNLKDEMAGRLSSVSSQTPWRQGYDFARQLRRLLNWGEAPFVPSIESLGTLFRIPPGLWSRSVALKNGAWDFLSGAVGATRHGAPYFAIQKRREPGKVFTLCRAIFEYLTTTDAPAAIVTQTYSDRQKRNRAFAAEFIAPAEQLRGCIRGDTIAEEDIQELAEAFGTSEFVIRHQIRNHGIINISEWF